MHEVSIIDLAKLLGTLSSTVLAILSVPLYMRYLQRQQFHNLCLRREYNSKVALDPVCKEELNWWISNLRLSNGRSVISHQVENLIESYASKTSRGAFCQKTSIGRVWYQAEQALHINILELMAAKFAVLTFCRNKKDLAVHVQMENQAALAYLVKMEGTRNQLIIQEAKEIWEFFLANQITLTAEYLPGTLNTRANKASREMKNSSSEWVLNKPIFQKLIQALVPMDVDMSASKLCHQIPKYINWQPDLHAWMVNAFQINWTHLKAYPFPPFTLTGRVLAKAMRGKCTLIIITPAWPSQLWYTQLLRMSIQDSIFISPFPNILTDPNQNQHPLCQNQTLALAVWKVSANSILQKACQTKQLTWLKVAEDQVHCIITKRGGESGVAGVFQEKLIPFLQV